MTDETEAHKQRLSAAMLDALAVIGHIDLAPYRPFEVLWIRHVAAELRALITEVGL